MHAALHRPRPSIGRPLARLVSGLERRGPPARSAPPRARVLAAASATPTPTPTTTTPSTPPPALPSPSLIDLAVEDAWAPGDPPTPLMADRIAFLEADLPHLFDGVGIDAAAYAPAVAFTDPITRYSSLAGYLFNIAALKRVFSPSFTLLGARQTGPRQVTTRWAMEMVAAPLKPLLGARAPALAFTGTSVMGFDTAGRVASHADTWDAITNQAYFSAEGAAHVAAQVGDLRRGPALWTPPYRLLRKQGGGLEVRAYPAFRVMEGRVVGGGGGGGGGGFGGGDLRVTLFRALAGMLESTGASMTTPVLSAPGGSDGGDAAGGAVALEAGGDGPGAPRMRFALSPADADRVTAALASGSARPPPGVEIDVIEVPGGTFAALPLGGRDPADAAAALRARLVTDFGAAGAPLADPSPAAFTVARYNSPLTPPPLRKEEVMVRLASFDLWA